MVNVSISKLANFVLQLDPSTLPAECLNAAKRCFIDYFAVTLAGSKQPISKTLERYLTEYKGTSSVIVVVTKRRWKVQPLLMER